MFNIENYGITTGRLTTDPQVYENSDGSCKIRITVAAANNYKNRDGSRGAQFLPLEDFISAKRARKGNRVYDLMHQGDKVTVQYTVKNNNYEKVNAAGVSEMVYGIVLQIDNIRLLESRTTTSARQAAKAEAQAQKEADEEKQKAGTRKSTKSSGKKTVA